MSAVQSKRQRPERLSESVGDDLRHRIESGEWKPSERLPGEHELAAHYGVSRATIRTALRVLDSRGLAVTLHGRGTFATASTGAVSSDLHRLESMSRTIERLNRKPGMNYRTIAIRSAEPGEAAGLTIKAGMPILATEREITADGEVVAYSHDAIPLDVLGDDFDVRSVTGSMFGLLEERGIEVTTAITGIHASAGEDIGWGAHPQGTLFV
ncbi:MAG: GntR family transcriptional regulator, partial [Ilumatobacter sp.]